MYKIVSESKVDISAASSSQCSDTVDTEAVAWLAASCVATAAHFLYC